MATTTRWTAQWKELFEEVVTTGLCTGCAGCVISCPHEVIGYKHEVGHYKPFHLEDELGPADCTHGQKGCTSCTRACPRFRTWETDADVPNISPQAFQELAEKAKAGCPVSKVLNAKITLDKKLEA